MELMSSTAIMTCPPVLLVLVEGRDDGGSQVTHT
jgi:hypothetical protein